mmetsp:Transcript_23545/g.35231  ORF Transcript_23545/g.35231 Transcript_23545/m.35231 type:complete len:244 (-) Transcript_23545:238-969(-)
MDAKKNEEIAQFQILYVEALEKFKTEEKSLLEIFGELSGLIEAAPAPAEEPVPEPETKEEEKKEAEVPESNGDHVSPNYKSTFKLEDKSPQVRSSTRIHASPGGKTSIILGDDGPSQAPRKVISSTVRHAPPGGISSVPIGGGSNQDTKYIESIPNVDGKKCSKLAKIISTSGKIRSVFEKFAGDGNTKVIFKDSFKEYTDRISIGFTKEEIDSIFSTFVKRGPSDAMKLSSFVRFVRVISPE